MPLKPALFLATLLVAASVSAGQLRIDFNHRTNDFPVATQEGFDAFVIRTGSTAAQTNTSTLQFGTITVSLSDLASTGYSDRKRSFPTNSATFTNAQIFQDFIFATGTTTNDGLVVRVQGLVSNQSYPFTIWSFDSSADGNRASDWFANGVLVKSNYTFDGNLRPTSNTDNKFSFSAVADSAGEVLVIGRRRITSVTQNNTPAVGVFLNALAIDSIPEQGPPCGTLEHFKPGSNLYGWTGGYTFADQDLEVASLKEAGMQWARINVVWFAVEPQQKGTYDPGLLTLYDHLMEKLAENGIRAIFVTADTPYWASSDPGKFTDSSGQHWSTRYKAANLNDFSDYMVFLANRYRSTGPHAFEIWNEENENYYWPPVASATDYVNMLSNAYTAIKAADPQAIVLNGGLTDNSSLSNYLVALYVAGARPYFDAWSQHIYRRTPQYETAVQTARNIMVANGDVAKKIWVTETGWTTYTNATDPSAVSYARQAHYLTNLFTRLAAYPYVEVGLWYTSRSYDETEKEGSFGLMLPDFTRKPSFYAYQEWVAMAGRHCFPYFINVSTPTILSNGIPRLRFNADPGFNYIVQSCANLGSWLNVSTNVADQNGVFFYEDFTATNSTQRFYRVIWP
jgi:polysaccharide biosynthesis protein PslG